MRTVTTSDGLAIAVTDFGGDGPDLVLAHATGFHAHVWRPLVERLTPHFRCVAFDQRGHGDSETPPDGDFAWNGFARDVRAVVEGLELARPYGVGHSCGGATLLMAEEDHPGTFRSLYCYEPIVPPIDGPAPEGATGLPESARRRREVFASRDAAYENYASKPPLSVLDRDALRAYVDFGFEDLDDGTVRLKCRGESEARTFENGGTHDTFSRLHAVTCPVVLACGGKTDAFGEPTMQLIRARVAASRVEVFADLGHFGPMEAPAAVATSIIRSFEPG